MLQTYHMIRMKINERRFIMQKEILKRKQYSSHPDDEHLEIILARVEWGCQPFVTWCYDNEADNCFWGHYFSILEDAEEDFKKRSY